MPKVTQSSSGTGPGLILPQHRVLRVCVYEREREKERQRERNGELKRKIECLPLQRSQSLWKSIWESV